jgi:hypothetical protein
MEHTSSGQALRLKATGILNQRISGREDNVMRFANRHISSLILTAALAAPAVVLANALPQEATVQVRVYDSHHHDYHNWDEREDHAYRLYLEGEHRQYVEYSHQSHKVQNNYWNWRHSHPD